MQKIAIAEILLVHQGVFKGSPVAKWPSPFTKENKAISNSKKKKKSISIFQFSC